MLYRIAAQRVASETLDGEVVVLDQIAGTYYGLDGPGVTIWEMLQRGASPDDIVTALAALYELPADGASAPADAVQAIIATLLADGLLDTVDGVAAPIHHDGGAKQPWTTPQLQRYTDLQSLLMLDPIHDVDESGWPKRPDQP